MLLKKSFENILMVVHVFLVFMVNFCYDENHSLLKKWLEQQKLKTKLSDNLTVSEVFTELLEQDILGPICFFYHFRV